MRERRLIWTILSLTLIASSLSALNVHRVKAGDVTVSVEPADNAYDPGEQFTISINIGNVWGLHAWELKLRYSPTYLYTNYTESSPSSLIQKGDFLSQNGLLDTYFAVYFGPTYVQLAELIKTYDATDGDGTLVTITFIVQDWGCCPLEIYDLSLLDVNSLPIDPIINNGKFYTNTPNAGVYSVKHPLSLEPATENTMFDTAPRYTADYKFNVTVWNTGTGAQTFDVKFYYNSSKTWNATTLAGFTQIGTTVTVTNLASMGSQLIQFTWKPSAVSPHPYNHTITFLAKISGMASDGNAEDDTNLPPYLPLLFKILKGGDCNGDGRINYKDLGILAVHYGKLIPPGDPRADFNEDGRINYKDLGILAVNYGKTYT